MITERAFLNAIRSIELLPTQPKENSYDPLDAFQAKARPTISIRQYINRLFAMSKCSYSVLIVAYIYLKRIQTIASINSGNIHRLLLASILVASKWVEDEFYDNAGFAQIGGVSLKEMNWLEWSLVGCLEYNISAEWSQFHECVTVLEGTSVC